MDDDLTEYPTHRVRLQQCQICGRQFNVESLKKHQSICRKVSTKKRKVFDAGKQRAQDSDVPYKATTKTAQIYKGEYRPQDDRSRSKPKANWREKHKQLIQSIREARSVTRAMKQGGPLPAFRPSEVPSDYVACPYCRRNFNEHVAQRHIPFCQTQHERKQPSNRNPQNFDRGRTLPPQHSSAHKQQSSSSSMYSNSHDIYNNGYKHSNSAPMIVRRNPPELQPPPPSRKTNGGGGGGWGSFRKLFGLGPKEESMPPPSNYYSPDEEDDYEPPVRRPVQQPVLMRTGRTQANTSLNVRARQKSNETTSYNRRVLPPPVAPPSYGQGRYQYGNGQYNSSRPTAVGRPPPPPSSGVRCGECGNFFNNASARYCPQCGSRR